MLRRTAHEAKVAGRVLFTGERPVVPDGTPGPDLPSLTLSAMDQFASRPRRRPSSAAVEALASGLPVLYAPARRSEDLPPEAAPTPAGARRPRRVRPRDRRGPSGGPRHRARRRGPRYTTASPAARPAHGRVHGGRGGASPSACTVSTAATAMSLRTFEGASRHDTP
ncbi:hypothetical protein GCM10023238_00840 [Streptomyces heliomycini]